MKYQSGTQAVVADGIEEGDLVIENVDLEELFDGARVKAEK